MKKTNRDRIEKIIERIFLILIIAIWCWTIWVAATLLIWIPAIILEDNLIRLEGNIITYFKNKFK
jgi:hypothetical protein